jgi:hypothetical protein
VRSPNDGFKSDFVEEPPRLTKADSGCDGNQREGFEPSALCGEAVHGSGICQSAQTECTDLN